MIRSFVVALFCTLVCGCAAGPPLYTSGEVTATSLDDGGALAGSIAYASDAQTWEHYDSYRVWIDRIGGQKNCAFLTVFDADPKTFEIHTGNLLGNTFYALLKPGDYQISGLNFFRNSGSGGNAINVTLPTPIHFTVRKGETSYLGRFSAFGLRGKNFLGLPAPAGGYFEISDAHEEDLKLLGAKLPGLNAKLSVIAPDPALHEFIRPVGVR